MPPVVIAGGIAAAGAVGAAAIGSSAASKASKTQAQGNAQAIASQERGRAEAAAALAPWQNAGLQANSLLQSALGYGGQQTLPTQQPNALAQYQGPNPDTSSFNSSRFGADGLGPNLGNDMFVSPRQSVPPNSVGMDQFATPQYAAQQGQQQGQPSAQSAFDTFLNSTNYNWQLQQGQNALNGGYAGAGTLQSGAAVKAFGDYNQNMARGAFQDWFGSVENMANRGYGAAAAQAGVSTNTANNVSNLNSANANALANLQIAKGNNTASLIGGLGQIGGYVAGNVLKPSTAAPGTIVTNGGGSRYTNPNPFGNGF